jgi:indolepyruvate ferredoxin oxidoreductase beta subunit
MGGEGGGVLADWIIDAAEHGAHLAQATSVPGVAQRTGATIYYIELFPKPAAMAAGKEPVLALMPMPGDVDVVIASELMEAGRAVQRGLVTPDRTTLIASTHRVYAMSERIALADGRVDDAAILEGCQTAARRMIAFDMAGIAEATGSVISAVLLGALAGSGALPFPRTAFEASIRRGGVGVAASVAAFTAGYEAAREDPPKETAKGAGDTGGSEPQASPEVSALQRQAEQMFPEAAHSILLAGVERTADYQDLDYAKAYLERLRPFIDIEVKHPDRNGRLLAETARQLALGMTYEDTIRVAELKIRPDRFARVREEVRLGEGQVLEIAEFLHPRVQEIADTLPERLGRWLLDTPWARRTAERLTASGRVLKTSSIRGFLTLYAVAALKPMRRRSLRFRAEQAFLDDWLRIVHETAARDYALAAEVAECRNLVKGYGDTHERGRARFDTLIRILPHLAGRSDGAANLARLRKAANADDTGAALTAAIKELRTLPQAAE